MTELYVLPPLYELPLLTPPPPPPLLTEGAAERKEEPPTLPLDRAANASSGTTAEVSMRPARAAAKSGTARIFGVSSVRSLPLVRLTRACFFAAHTSLGACTHLGVCRPRRTGSAVPLSPVDVSIFSAFLTNSTLNEMCNGS